MLNYKKTVYLTFDDGIQPGTSEVINVLNNMSVKATFFLTGIHTLYSLTKNKKEVFETLNNMLINHIIGNHSFSHCYGFYQSYYSKGLLIGQSDKGASICEDFRINKEYIKNLIKYCPIYKQKPSIQRSISIDKIARLPGRNSFYISTKKASNYNYSSVYVECEHDSLEAATKLSFLKYQVFGWDDEWKMSFDFAANTRIINNERIKNNNIDYANMLQIYPDLDMISRENINKDRLIESWQVVANRILNSSKRKIILLMHDRAFRKNIYNKEKYIYANQLKYLIEYLIQKKVKFGTLG